MTADPVPVVPMTERAEGAGDDVPDGDKRAERTVPPAADGSRNTVCEYLSQQGLPRAP